MRCPGQGLYQLPQAGNLALELGVLGDEAGVGARQPAVLRPQRLDLGGKPVPFHQDPLQREPSLRTLLSKHPELAVLGFKEGAFGFQGGDPAPS